MNPPVHVPRLLSIVLCVLTAPGIRAQQIETRVDSAEVVYIEANDVVLKLNSGEVKQFEIPVGNTFTIDGKDLSVQELKPGMKLTATIATTTAPLSVDTVEIIDVGTVWKSLGSSLIITRPDGEKRMYRVPSGSKITLGGIEKTVDQLREGDKITATVIKTWVPSEKSQASRHVPHPLVTPARVGTLLIDEGAKAIETPPMWQWSTIAIIVLIICILFVAALVLLAFRRRREGRKV